MSLCLLLLLASILHVFTEVSFTSCPWGSYHALLGLFGSCPPASPGTGVSVVPPFGLGAAGGCALLGMIHLGGRRLLWLVSLGVTRSPLWVRGSMGGRPAAAAGGLLWCSCCWGLLCWWGLYGLWGPLWSLAFWPCVPAHQGWYASPPVPHLPLPARAGPTPDCLLLCTSHISHFTVYITPRHI